MRSVVIGLVTVMVAARSASALVVAYNEAGAATNVAGYGASGFQFTVTQAIDVEELGFRAVDIGGGDDPHVLLWNVTTATLLDEVFTGAPLSNGWHYIALDSPVTLTPGNTYQVAAEIYWVPTYADTSGFTYGPEIATPTFVRNASGGFGDWTTYSGAPLTGAASPASTGANFTYSVAVPEPAMLAPLALGFVALRRRK